MNDTIACTFGTRQFTKYIHIYVVFNKACTRFVSELPTLQEELCGVPNSENLCQRSGLGVLYPNQLCGFGVSIIVFYSPW